MGTMHGRGHGELRHGVQQQQQPIDTLHTVIQHLVTLNPEIVTH